MKDYSDYPKSYSVSFGSSVPVEIKEDRCDSGKANHREHAENEVLPVTQWFRKTIRHGYHQQTKSD